ncbi:alpha/beta hydrolase [Subsaximicrobium wynnwilliamsii]|uniref:Alpha/beta hydrolase n=1 Tax=Subsaximicrobium wynnwilliamsii TaxID=291179 RepID=A0A5C6ZL49_9FLAO|nr:alpha/beta fold hydrolase [Subsaximicrobium wynnwilliamsii]TXD84287.1 alpha/beta hydrolase [Subsaximicrobium wynnwilliamsii]TXD89908.1 alpha/beta hydrolase [Subsaximicrobium wynnwilliamsii]TXE03999.1 alpha/beta hydrolase [Subsaximicrobium wynnwilliamsii]
MQEQPIHVQTKDDVSIAVWKSNPKQSNGKVVFLTHGAFSNRQIFNGIVGALTQNGFTCWSMEWRNHGESEHSPSKFNLETVAEFDLSATLNFLVNKQGLKSFDCITHSGGGLVLTMFLIKNPSYRASIKSISMFGVQAFGAGSKLKNRMKIFAGKYVSAMLGKVPSKPAGSIENSESYHTLKQWFDWNLKKNFVGEDGFDYREKMKSIQIPILSICAKGDHFIAPKEGCQQYLEAFENPQNKLIYFALENGNLEDYSHSRIILSRNSEKEIYPVVLKWIHESASSKSKA